MTSTGESGARVLTWKQADALMPYDAIERWRTHEQAVLREHEPEHHLEELALMAVAAQWLTRWQPIAMHRAILAGATPAEVAEAAGVSVRDVYERWEKWGMLSGRPRSVTVHPCPKMCTPRSSRGSLRCSS